MTAYLHALDPSGNLIPLETDVNGALKVAASVSIPAPEGGATEAKQDDQIDLLGGGLPAALTGSGNLKVAIVESTAGGLTNTELRATPVDVTTAGFSQTGVDTLSVTDSSARVELAATGPTLLVRNEGTTTAYIALGAGTVTAATTGYPVDPLTVVTLARDPATQTHLAAITASGTTTLTAIAGTGGVDPQLPLGMAATGSVTVANDVTLGALPHANLGAFGDLETMELMPLCQLSFATGLREQLLTTSTANSATVDVNTGRLRLQTGTNAAGSAVAFSTKPVSYRPGQGITARYTPFWVGGAASSTQIAGMGNSVDGYFFGYNGTSFGICYRANSVDTWTAQASWNGDTCDGNGASGFDLDPSKGVPMMIKYPYLGHGNVRFYIQNPATSLWILAHTIRYADTSALPQLTNPCLSFYAHSVNSGNTSNLIGYVTCVGVFMDGPRVYLGPQFGTENNKSGITTETNILSLRNATTVNGVANRGLMRLRQVSIATTGNTSIVTLRVKRGVTVGGSPSFAAISGTTADSGVTITSAQSTASVDTAGTTITGGTTIYNASISNSTGNVFDLTPFDIYIAPGETLTFSGAASASAVISVTVNWQEDIQ
jgi:hypothetical protein